MGTILLLALAAAVYPQLLAVVVVILTRPDPRPLLWACYLGSLVVNVGGGILIFAIFRARGTIAGTSSQRLGPSAYLVIGAIAVVIGAAVATPRGRALIGRDRSKLRREGNAREGQSSAGRMKARAEVKLSEGSLAVAGLAGAILALPGPFDLLALGHLARSDYRAIVAVGVIVVFALIKYLLIEVPIVSYAVDPNGTALRVSRFSDWMQANAITVVAGIVGVLGVVLIGRGISGLG